MSLHGSCVVDDVKDGLVDTGCARVEVLCEPDTLVRCDGVVCTVTDALCEIGYREEDTTDGDTGVFVAIETCDVDCCEAVGIPCGNIGVCVAFETCDGICCVAVGNIDDDKGVLATFEVCEVSCCEVVGNMDDDKGMFVLNDACDTGF